MTPSFYVFRCAALALLTGLGIASSAQAQSGSVATTQSFSYTGQIVTWTVPTGVTSLTIEARGAEGAANRNSGLGAILRGVVSVTPAQTLTLLVGGQPQENRGISTAGGGGGSFVVTTLNNVLQPLVIAGGGGGGGNLTTDSPAKHGQTGTVGGEATNSGGMGGTDGKGGQGGNGQYAASGGGGLFTDGTGFAGGKAFVNGGRGGAQDERGNNAGFGGGGASLVLIGSNGASIAGGGGGGYSGGGGASANGDGTGGGYGGGGGSYTIDPNGTAQVGATNGNPGNGLVIISYLPPCSPFTVNLQNDGDLTCVKTSGLLTTIGGLTGASYTYSPGAQASSTSSTTATVTTSGLYSVTVTAPGGCSATATTNVQSNTVAPSAPTLVTASGYSYPAGVSSLTLSQNVGPVSLTASCCSDGQLSTSGGASSFTISTAMTGAQTYTATCTSTSNGCTSPAASFQLTVVPTTLSVLHRDADYGNTQNNIIKPYLQLANAGGQAMPYGELTVRYWFTSEGNALPTNLAVYYAQLGAVNMKYVALAQPRQGAFGYVEYSFPSGGSLAANSNSGPIENGIQKTDGSNFNETDDYSYQANYQNYVSNVRVTAYRNGTIVWGQEPTAVSSVTAVQVYTQAKDQTTTSQIQTRLELRNTGNRAIPAQDLRIRYYFTSDNNQPASVYVDYADIGASNIQARVIKLPAPVGGADSYVELRTLPTSLSIAAQGSLGAIDFRLVRSDNGLFNQSNDYSYAPNYGNAGLNNRVTVLLNNRLIFGTPPAGAPARLGATEPVAVLGVQVLGNPVVGDQAQIVITGVVGQAVSLRLVDLQGRAVHEQRIEQVGETELVSVPLGQSRGLLLLKISTDSQQQSVKLLRP